MELMESVWLIAAIATLAFGFFGAPIWLWSALIIGILWFIQVSPTIFGIAIAIAVVFSVPHIRRFLISSIVFKLIKSFNVLPQISETESIALKAGNVWVEKDLFSGKPNFKNLLSEPYPDLTAEEKAFLDGPVEKLCKLATDWEITQKRDLPERCWEYIKKEKFFGMIIPKKYGGLEYSALAHSAVVQKLASRSIPLCVTVMVPNSLGPAELINHYGTEEQKRHYLPRLANGEEIPCFALTEPTAGSDAASIQATGEVFKGDDGKLYLKLNWNKRWITLAAVSTLLGLAFKLKDPDNLLGQGTDVGITCGLVPTNTPGVTATHRHDPLTVPFFNCPTLGKDVVVPIDSIIGGPEMAGKGWKMLMESLAAGRGISLPAQSAGGVKYSARVSSAHAMVRKQFGVSIGKFEGIAEPLARLSGLSYLMEASRKYTCGAIDKGSKPPVVTAIAKYHMTELCRKGLNDGMDILGGAGISRGPRNLLANGYIAAPIAITVEGANIMTRTLIIFGQGALRAHPFAFQQVDAANENNLAKFDRAFFGHVMHVVRNTFRAVLLSLTRGYLIPPQTDLATWKYYRKLGWTSACFAIMADIAMAAYGGKLKMKEKITGRFADILSWMYIATSVLRRYEAEGRKKEDFPLVQWSMKYAFANIQTAFDGILANFEIPLLGPLFRQPIRWWSGFNSLSTPPSDDLEIKVADMILTPGAQRDKITDGIFVPMNDKEEALGRLEEAFDLSIKSDSISRKVRKAVRKKKLKKKPARELIKDAVGAGVISKDEFEMISQAEEARYDAIQVDSFHVDEYAQHH